MARFRYSRNSFSAGVVSDEIQGNTEFESYNNGLAKCVNFHIHPTGGLFKRAGTKVVLDVEQDDIQYGYKLVPFVYSGAESYMLLVTKYKIFVMKRDAVITTLTVPVSDEVYASESPKFKTMEYGNADIDVSKLSYLQQGNVMYIFGYEGSSHVKVTRTGTETFEIACVRKIEYAPMSFIDELNKVSLLYMERLDGTNFVAKFEASYLPEDVIKRDKDIFGKGMDDLSYIAAEFEKTDGSKWSFGGRIILRETTTENFYIRVDEGSVPMASDLKDPTTKKWAIEEFVKGRGGTITNVSSFEGRTFIAGSDTNPTAVWGSATKYSYNPLYFSYGVDPTDAVQYISRSRDRVHWTVGLQKLFCGTGASILLAGSPGTSDSAITPDHFFIRVMEYTGSNSIKPVTAGGSVIFLSTGGDTVYEISLKAETQTYETTFLSLIGADITADGVKAATWQRAPKSTLWCALSDGTLACLSLLKSQGVIAWHSMRLEGEGAFVMDMASVFESKQDYVWFLVRRKINDRLSFTVEYLEKDGLERKNSFKQYYVDGGENLTNKGYLTEMTPSVKATATFKATAGEGAVDINQVTQEEVVKHSSNHWLSWENSDGEIYRCFTVNEKNQCTNLAYKTDGAPESYLGDPISSVENDHSLFFRTSAKVIEYSRQAGQSTAENSIYISVFKFDKSLGNINDVVDVAMYSYVDDIFNDGKIIVEFTGTVMADNVLRVEEKGDLINPEPSLKAKAGLKAEDFKNVHVFKKTIFKFEDVSTLTPTRFKTEGGIDSWENPIHVKFSNLTTMAANIEVDKTYIASKDSDNNLNVNHHLFFEQMGIVGSPERNIRGAFYDDGAYVDTTGSLPEQGGGEVYKQVQNDGNVIVNKRYMNSELDVSVNGIPLGKKTVMKDDGEEKYYIGVDADLEIFHICWGYAVNSYAETSPLSGGGMFGSSVGQEGIQHSCVIHVYRSMGGQYGTNSKRLFDIPYYNNKVGFDQPAERITRVINCPIENAYDKYDRRIVLQHDTPNSFNVLSIVQDVEVSDGV